MWRSMAAQLWPVWAIELAVSRGSPAAPGGKSPPWGAPATPAALVIVTAGTRERARAGAGGKHGNKGADAALAAVGMVSLLRTLRAEAPKRRVAAG